MSTLTPDACALCGRRTTLLTRHHLIPRARHKNRRNKRDFSRAEVHERTIMICHPCHKNLHAHIPNRDLERSYNNLETLRSHPEVRRFSQWARQRPADSHIRVHKARSGR